MEATGETASKPLPATGPVICVPKLGVPLANGALPSCQAALMDWLPEVGTDNNLQLRKPLLGMKRSTVTLVAPVSAPGATWPSDAVPVPSDLNVTELPPKSAVPVIVSVLVGLTTSVPPVPNVKLFVEPTVKFWLSVTS
jgi:hypothetical protein